MKKDNLMIQKKDKLRSLKGLSLYSLYIVIIGLCDSFVDFDGFTYLLLHQVRFFLLLIIMLEFAFQVLQQKNSKREYIAILIIWYGSFFFREIVKHLFTKIQAQPFLFLYKEYSLYNLFVVRLEMLSCIDNLLWNIACILITFILLNIKEYRSTIFLITNIIIFIFVGGYFMYLYYSGCDYNGSGFILASNMVTTVNLFILIKVINAHMENGYLKKGGY